VTSQERRDQAFRLHCAIIDMVSRYASAYERWVHSGDAADYRAMRRRWVAMDRLTKALRLLADH